MRILESHVKKLLVSGTKAGIVSGGMDIIVVLIRIYRGQRLSWIMLLQVGSLDERNCSGVIDDTLNLIHQWMVLQP